MSDNTRPFAYTGLNPTMRHLANPAAPSSGLNLYSDKLIERDPNHAGTAAFLRHHEVSP